MDEMGLFKDARNTIVRPPGREVAIARCQPGTAITARVSPADPYRLMIG
jgi:hypothetical protein